MTLTIDSRTRAPRRLRRTTALAAVATLALQMGGQSLMQAGGKEPAFDAPAAEIAAFFAGTDRDLFAAGSFLTALSIVSFLWFVGGLYSLLRDDWRAPIALACGVLYAASAGVGWELAVFREPEGIDPELARLAFDLGNLSFASAWVALGGFTIAVGWILIAREEARRLGWLAVGAGVALVGARISWTESYWLVGYALFWVWAVALSVTLLRASGPAVGTRRTS